MISLFFTIDLCFSVSEECGHTYKQHLLLGIGFGTESLRVTGDSLVMIIVFLDR